MHRITFKLVLLVTALVLIVGLYFFVLIAAFWASFTAFRNGQDGWSPLAVALILLYSGDRTRNEARIIKALQDLRSDLESTKALSDAAVQALAMQLMDDEVAERSQWN